MHPQQFPPRHNPQHRVRFPVPPALPPQMLQPVPQPMRQPMQPTWPPHGDPNQQFRPVPLAKNRVWAYSLIVIAGLMGTLGFPFLIDATLNQPADLPPMELKDALAESVLTDPEWPVTFHALGECEVRSTLEMGVATFSCQDAVVRMYGVGGVSNVPLAVARSARAMGLEDVQESAVQPFTSQAKRENPLVLRDSGAEEVYSVQGLQSEDSTGDATQPTEIVSFFRPGEDEQMGGTLVTLEIAAATADQVEQTRAELVDSVDQHE